MKLIIELPDEVKDAFDNASNEDINFSYYDYNSVIGKAIRNGTPLPEGHVRLVDADALIKEKSYCTAICLRDACDNCQYKCVAKYDITNAPTIIEADKENADENCN